jgi:GNAT superfamily N-acetyltransferase
LDDLPAILSLDDMARRGDAERTSFLRRSMTSLHCRVAVADDAVLGYLVMTPTHFFGRDFVDLLYVAPAVRRSGVGAHLLWAARALEGTAQVFTSTNRSNQPMRSLLEVTGWTLSGALDGLDAGDPELVFLVSRSTEIEG